MMITFSLSNSIQLDLIKELAPNQSKHSEVISFINEQLTSLYKDKTKSIPPEITQDIVARKIRVALSWLYLSFRYEKKANKLEHKISTLEDQIHKEKDSNKLKAMTKDKDTMVLQESEIRKKANKFGLLFRTLKAGISTVVRQKFPKPSDAEIKCITNIQDKFEEYESILNDISSEPTAKKITIAPEAKKSLSDDVQKENPQSQQNEFFFEIEEIGTGDGAGEWTLPPKPAAKK